MATVTTSTLGVVGPNAITAEYSGFQIYDPSTTAASITQVVNKAELTVTAVNMLRLPNTANPDPFLYEVTGFQNGENLGTSGVTGTPALTTTAVLPRPSETVTQSPAPWAPWHRTTTLRDVCRRHPDRCRCGGYLQRQFLQQS